MASKKKPKDEGEDILDQINAEFGAGTLLAMDCVPPQVYDVVSTGSLNLDDALGVGGFPRGRIVEVYGPEACLDADTFVSYEIRAANGERQNHKGGSIERLWHRFHGVPMSGSGSYQRAQTVDSTFYVSSINEDGRVFKNRVVDVVRTGRKPCLEILTHEGRVVATPEHKFWTGTKFVPASQLEVGSIVYTHNNTPYARGERDRMLEAGADQRAYLYVKTHPVAGVKVVRDRARGYENAYYRLARSRAVVEAGMNGLDLDRYVERLNAGDIGGLQFLTRDDHVHHVDEDVTNDALNNLAVISASDHGRLHAMERHNNLRFTAVPMEVVEINDAGDRETFDIRVESPFNNYVAAGFVVHNSGKTTIALQTIANAQRAGHRCAFIDAEHALDVNYAVALGVDLSLTAVAQPDYGEQALEVCDRLCKSGKFAVIVVDSVAALTPKAELEGDMESLQVGAQARMMSKAMRKLVVAAAVTDTLLVFINQTRSKIGGYGNPETTPGGNALKFAASIRIRIVRTGSSKQGEVKVSNTTLAKVVKNKCAPPFREAEFEITFGKGVELESELLDFALDKGLIVKSGSWFSLADGTRIAQGKENVKQWLRDNPSQTQALLGALRT